MQIEKNQLLQVSWVELGSSSCKLVDLPLCHTLWDTFKRCMFYTFHRTNNQKYINNFWSSSSNFSKSFLPYISKEIVTVRIFEILLFLMLYLRLFQIGAFFLSSRQSLDITSINLWKLTNLSDFSFYFELSFCFL